MDFVTKKVFEQKLKSVGKDLGLTSSKTTKPSIFGGNDEPSNQNPLSSIFNPSSTDPDIESQSDIFATSQADAYGAKPKNFPFCLPLFYLDRTILSEHAFSPVNWALRTLYATELMLLVNFIVAIVIFSLDDQKSKHWVHLLLSAIFALLITVYQLVSFDTAFRGAYRTSRNLRMRYLYLAAANIIIPLVYALVGSAWFHGLTRLGDIGEATKNAVVQRFLVIAESIGWAAVAFMTIFVWFDYYHLFNSGEQGLSPGALRQADEAVSRGDLAQRRAQQMSSQQRERQTQVQAIRDKYAAGR